MNMLYIYFLLGDPSGHALVISSEQYQRNPLNVTPFFRYPISLKKLNLVILAAWLNPWECAAEYLVCQYPMATAYKYSKRVVIEICCSADKKI